MKTFKHGNWECKCDLHYTKEDEYRLWLDIVAGRQLFCNGTLVDNVIQARNNVGTAIEVESWTNFDLRNVCPICHWHRFRVIPNPYYRGA